MKRILQNHNQKKKAELRKLTMKQLKKMRKEMNKEHPDLLNKIRKLWESSQKKQQKKVVKVEHVNHPEQQSSPYAVDQEKNKEAIEKLLELKGHSPGFQKSVQAMLASKK